MKLTQSQIEAERVNFEKYFVNKTEYELWSDWYEFYSSENKYASYTVNEGWKIWLGCRESIEITLSIALCGHDSGYKRVYNEAIADVKEIIELQGFTVVTK